MAKDNEEVKSTLLEGNTRFSSAATVMGNVKTELETLLANLNWQGPSDKSAKDAYMQVHTQFSTDAGMAQDILQKCAGALKSLHDAIVEAEEKAKQAKEQQDTEEVVILGVLTFAQAVEMIVTPLLIAADEAAAATLETVETEVMQLPDVLQDVEAVNALPAVDDVTTLPVNDIPPPDAPTGEAPTAPTGEAPTAPMGEAPTAPTGEAPTTPTGEAPTAPMGEAPTTPTGEAPTTPEDPPPAGKDTREVGGGKRDSGVDFGKTEEPGKFGDPPTGESPKTPEAQPPKTPEENPVEGKDTPGAGAGKHDSGVDFGKPEEPGKFGDLPQKYGDIPFDELPNHMPPQEVQANPVWGEIKPNGNFQVTEIDESTGAKTVTVYDKDQNLIYAQKSWKSNGYDILQTTYADGSQSTMAMKNGKVVESYYKSINPQTGTTTEYSTNNSTDVTRTIYKDTATGKVKVTVIEIPTLTGGKTVTIYDENGIEISSTEYDASGNPVNFLPANPDGPSTTPIYGPNYKDPVGSYKKAPVEPSKAPVEPSKAPAGPSKAPAGPSKAPAGPSKAPAGPSNAPPARRSGFHGFRQVDPSLPRSTRNPPLTRPPRQPAPNPPQGGSSQQPEPDPNAYDPIKDPKGKKRQN